MIPILSPVFTKGPSPCMAPISIPAARFLNLHEYHSRQLLHDTGVLVPPGNVAHTAEEAFSVAESIGTGKYVVKAQVLTGGRGLGHFENGFKGGVHTAHTPEEVQELASKMIGNKLITKQTGSSGLQCDSVLVVDQAEVSSEKYIAFLLDRASRGVSVVSSPQGGTSIESIAEEDPNLVRNIPISIDTGLTPIIKQQILDHMQIGGSTRAIAESQLDKMYDFFMSSDSLMLEINPLVIDSKENLLALDAKVSFDDNAEFRQNDIFQRKDLTQEDPREVEASQFDLNYIQLDGDIGCLVNGAGLALATCDLLSLHKGTPANFLDVGGSASTGQVEAAFKILQSQKGAIKSILVNIFGGIMQCDIIAQGVIDAAQRVKLDVPLVIRLEGTNSQKGMDMISSSSLENVYTATSFDEAARIACEKASATI